MTRLHLHTPANLMGKLIMTNFQISSSLGEIVTATLKYAALTIGLPKANVQFTEAFNSSGIENRK